METGVPQNSPRSSESDVRMPESASSDKPQSSWSAQFFSDIKALGNKRSILDLAKKEYIMREH
eukprot:6282117-Pyramimonas_sp.AAC.1